VEQVPEIDVSLTSISPRIARLAPVIASILGQTLPPARVLIHLSRDAYLLDQGIADLPADLAALVDGSRVQVVWVENTGPYRKILPWLVQHIGSPRLVVTADDDTLYPPDWLARLAAGRTATGAVTAWSAHPIPLKGGRVAGYGRWFNAPRPDGPALRLLPIGKDGVLYAGTDFPVEVLDFATARQLVPTGDDLWLRWHLARVGIRAQAVGQGAPLAEVSRGGPSLWRDFNRNGGNDALVAGLEAHFAATFGWQMAQAPC
jgi:hypothetical protein